MNEPLFETFSDEDVYEFECDLAGAIGIVILVGIIGVTLYAVFAT